MDAFYCHAISQPDALEHAFREEIAARPLEEVCLEVADRIVRAKHVTVLTGAGISIAAGIPAFRGEGGLYTDPDTGAKAREACSRHALEKDPCRFWTDHLAFARKHFANKKPTRAHELLRKWQLDGTLHSVITQNIDTLHEDCGTESVVHYHGRVGKTVCVACKRPTPPRYELDWIHFTDSLLPPVCFYPECSGTLRPAVTLFGDAVDESVIAETDAIADKTDMLLVVGSSLSVYPAALIPSRVQDHGTVVMVNPECPEGMRPGPDRFWIKGTADQALDYLDCAIGCAKKKKCKEKQ